jgi:hypothetical protein
MTHPYLSWLSDICSCKLVILRYPRRITCPKRRICSFCPSMDHKARPPLERSGLHAAHRRLASPGWARALFLVVPLRVPPIPSKPSIQHASRRILSRGGVATTYKDETHHGASLPLAYGAEGGGPEAGQRINCFEVACCIPR